MSEKDEQLLLKYAMYTILYCNNLAYNCIIELKPFVEKKDKETRKIYGALHKRMRHYYVTIRDIVQTEGNNFIADFSSFMDDINDDVVEEYRASIILAYRKGGITDYGFLGYLETARSMFYFSISTIDAFVEKYNKEGINIRNLKSYTLKSYSRVLDNLVNWCYRHAIKEVSNTLDLTKEKDVMKCFAKINENILNFDSFYNCYNNAVELAKIQ